MNVQCLLSPVVSKQGEEVNIMKAKQISDGQSLTSEEDGQKLKVSEEKQLLSISLALINHHTIVLLTDTF